MHSVSKGINPFPTVYIFLKTVLALDLAEKNKECAVQIFPPKRKKKSFVDFYFEEIKRQAVSYGIGRKNLLYCLQR